MMLLSTTRPVTLLLEGQVYSEWTRAEVSRDLEDLAGQFSVELRDGTRSWSSWPFASLAALSRRVVAGLDVEVLVDGESVLKGWVDRVRPRAAEGQVSVTITGCDKTADLADCAATLKPPYEYQDITIEQVAGKILAPYGLKVRAEAEVGEPFERYAIDVAETALSAIEKGARQRSLLVTSDGRDTVLLTQSGRTRASGVLAFPGNVISSAGEFSADRRHSHYRVKGQAERAGGRRRMSAYLKASQAPAARDASSWVEQQRDHETAGVAVTGEEDDEDMSSRYRPLVSMGRTQLTKMGARDQARWMRRTARGRSEALDYEVLGYRDQAGQLWRPNTLVQVSDRFQGVFRDMLIAGVVYTHDDNGSRTRLRLCGPEAYDVAAQGTRVKNSRPLDGTAEPLS